MVRDHLAEIGQAFKCEFRTDPLGMVGDRHAGPD